MLKHSSHLEKAATACFTTADADSRLAERVEEFTNWEGEINEIVHYTRKGVNGRDILINILLSDEDNENKDIIFSPEFQFFGAKIGINNSAQYCVILTYASYLGDNIDLEDRPRGK